MAGPFKIIDEAADDRMAGATSVWAYAPRILIYPLSGYCLYVLLFGTPIVWLLVQTLQAFAGGEPYSMIAALMRITVVTIGSTWLLSYILRVIGHTAAGHATSPPMAGDTMYNASVWFARALPYPAAFVSAFFALFEMQPQTAWAIAGLGVLLWPAHALSLATEGSAAAAINPLRLLQIVAGIGPLYLLICGVIGAAVWALSAFASNVYGTLFSGIGLYLVFMVSHLLGFIAFRRHEALNLIVQVGDPLEKQQAREQAVRLGALMTRLESCILRGDLEGAGRELFAEPGGPANVRQFHENLFTKLLSRGNATLIFEQGRRLITLLINEKRKSRALEVYETCLNKSPYFEPATTLQLELLAREALASKYEDLFLKILKNIEARYPDDPIIVTAGLMQARYWCEQRNDDVRALEILNPLLVHERHPSYPQVVALVRVLQGT